MPGTPAGAKAAVTQRRRKLHAPYSRLPPPVWTPPTDNRRRSKPSMAAPGTHQASSTESARPRGRGGGGQLQERRDGGRRGGNKATHVRGAQRRVCVAAPAASSTEGSPERREGPRRQAAPTTPAPRPDRSRAGSRPIEAAPDRSRAGSEHTGSDPTGSAPRRSCGAPARNGLAPDRPPHPIAPHSHRAIGPAARIQ
jgi:hypothetical protein